MIVSNTTPISNLLHIDHTSLLSKLFDTVYIPEAVADELEIAFSSYIKWKNCIKNKEIVIQTVTNTVLVKQMIPFLHQGEAEAICLALEKNAELCLMDDHDGRVVAKRNDLSVTGTLGLLLHAKEAGLIKSVKNLIDKLRVEHQFWIKEDMYQKVLHLAKENN